MTPRSKMRRPQLRRAPTNLPSLAPAVLAIVLAGAASAQDATEPPSLVGRIAQITGDVSMLRSGDQDWSAAEINAPVSIGDAVYAQDDGDARLQIGAVDLDLLAASEFDIASLDDQSGQLRLDSGSLDIRVSALPTADGLMIATPRGTVRLTQPGIYRIAAGDQDHPTQVTAWNGTAQLGDNGPLVTVQQGQTLVIAGTADAPQYSYAAIAADYPQEWRQPPRVVSSQQHYVSADMTGSEDLYSYGSFETDSNYGAVWYPRSVPADWQPYRYGHWEFVAPWGQTWVDDQPWGFAPFHYGRWARVGDRWGWCPGAYAPHPVYAPALVAFVGGGGFGVSVSVGGGAVGWVPLGPGEIYRPPYHVNETYVENVNRTLIVNNTVINRTTIINEYHNPPRPVANFANTRYATVAPASAIARGEPVSRAALKVSPEALSHATVNQQLVTDIRREPPASRPMAKAGPVRPVENARGAAVAARPPLLPPSAVHGGNPRGEPRPPAGAPPKPEGRPPEGRPAESAPARPENMTGARPEARPGNPPPPPTHAPAPERPAVGERPGSEKQPHPEDRRGEAPKPPAARPEEPRGEPARPAPRPEERAPASPPREARPAPEARPEARPQPQRPEPQRAEPQRPQPRPAPEPRPEARPQEAARPRPEAAPPKAEPHPAPPPPRAAPAKEPPKKEEKPQQ